jgi:hypothetical protein
MINLYDDAKHVITSHSGHGNSYWEEASNCGYARKLIDSGVRAFSSAVVPAWAARGTFYHLLHQWWQEDKFADDSIISASRSDETWNDAVTLFDWYRATYPKTIWGTCLGTEVQCPANEDQRAILAEHFSVPLIYAPTKRDDMITIISDDQVERALSYGAVLPGPGRYIVDFKHGQWHDGKDAAKYTLGHQACMYLALDRVLNPQSPAIGIIYSKVSMTRTKGVLELKDTSFRVYVATWLPSFAGRAKQMVRYGYESMRRAEKNPYACPSCDYYNQQCQGY